MTPGSARLPRRGRRLIPAELPRRRELVGVCAVAVVLAHLLLAQLTLVLAIGFALAGRATRWRLGWLLAPAVAGLAWALAAGPGHALAGFTAGPALVLSGFLRPAGAASAAGHPLAAFSGIGGWLPRQLPLALPAAAAEAAVLGWLDWLHTDEWAVLPPRPGAVAALRAALAARAIRAGSGVTGNGCALGIVASTGAVAGLRWSEISRGVLLAGADERQVMLAGLQVVHAALRLRKPVIVLAGRPDPAIAGALSAACRAAGTPLLGASAVPQRVDLGQVVIERLAALLPAGSPEFAQRACADIAALAADLRRIGVDGDALVWVPHGEQLPAPALTALLREGPAGLPALVGTTSPAAATALGALAGSTLIGRLADPDLAAALARRAGTRLLPLSAAAAAGPGSPGPVASAGGAGPGSAPSHLVPCPVLPPRTLLALGREEFVLVVSAPRARPPVYGRLVPAR
jgi:hypothetical protein